jgi:hypothetical protein
MKAQINEIKRMQQLAGIIKENSQYEDLGTGDSLPTIVKVEDQPYALLKSKGFNLVLTLSNGEKKNISSDELNGIYGNANDEDVIGLEWDQPPYSKN